VGVAAASQEAPVSIGMEDVSLVHLEAGGLALAVRELRKAERLPSCFKRQGFWPGAMVKSRVWLIRGG